MKDDQCEIEEESYSYILFLYELINDEYYLYFQQKVVEYEKKKKFIYSYFN